MQQNPAPDSVQTNSYVGTAASFPRCCGTTLTQSARTPAACFHVKTSALVPRTWTEQMC